MVTWRPWPVELFRHFNESPEVVISMFREFSKRGSSARNEDKTRILAGECNGHGFLSFSPRLLVAWTDFYPQPFTPYASRAKNSCQIWGIQINCFPISSFILLPLSLYIGGGGYLNGRPRITNPITVVLLSRRPRARLFVLFPLSALIIHPCPNARRSRRF